MGQTDPYKLVQPGAEPGWSVSRGGILLPASGIVQPGDALYEVVVWTLCGLERSTVEVACTKPMGVREFARRVRVASTIFHWTQNGCDACRDRLRDSTTAIEKEWIHATDPTLGPIVGFGAVER